MTYNEKYNDSCIKIFKFLKLLFTDKADYDTVLKLFSDDMNIKSNPNVILNKYLNTLKVFGIEVKKIKNKYHLIKSITTIDMDAEEAKALKLFKDYMEIYPKGKTKNIVEEFLHDIEIRADENALKVYESENIPKSFEYSIYFAKYAEQIEICEKYLNDGSKIELIYMDKSGQHKIMCYPKELIYKNKKITYAVVTHLSCNLMEIPVDSIIDMKVQPTSAGKPVFTSTVVYKIKGRLAKNYNIRPNERLEKVENDVKYIINCNEDMNILAKRLMRYGDLCEVVLPKTLREIMAQLIRESLSNYE